MRTTLFILLTISAVILVRAEDKPITAEITAHPPARLTMPPPVVLTNHSPEKSIAPELTFVKDHGPGKPGKLNAQTPSPDASRAKKTPSLAIAETNGLHQAVTVNRAAPKTESKPKIKADRLVLKDGNLPTAISDAKKLSNQE